MVWIVTRRSTVRHLFAVTLLCALCSRAAVAGSGDVAAYDAALCTLAQAMIVNAGTNIGAAPFAIIVQRGEGNGFHTIQMDVDPQTRSVIIATSVGTVQIDGRDLATHVACKMVDRDRVNDVLGLRLPGPERSCRDVNEHTYRMALDSLSDGERRRYEAAARPLVFADDYLAATGGEWLPSAVDDFIRPVPGMAASAGALEIRAASVRVPWNATERNFFQGTQHCKLITLAAMRRWMLNGALTGEQQLFPRSKPACDAPSSVTATAGSCVFYFAPAGSRFCEDYSGSGWNSESSRAECGQRHASAEALRAAANRYAGAGGIFSPESCAEREDAGALSGTCVFHCKRPDEALWHGLGSPATAGAGAGSASTMTRACDLFIP